MIGYAPGFDEASAAGPQWPDALSGRLRQIKESQAVRIGYRADAIPFAVAAYITAAYWFTASTSFANPAVTLARSATDTFAGIRPADAPAFIVAQLLGAGSATALFGWLTPRST